MVVSQLLYLRTQTPLPALRVGHLRRKTSRCVRVCVCLCVCMLSGKTMGENLAQVCVCACVRVCVCVCVCKRLCRVTVALGWAGSRQTTHKSVISQQLSCRYACIHTYNVILTPPSSLESVRRYVYIRSACRFKRAKHAATCLTFSPQCHALFPSVPVSVFVLQELRDLQAAVSAAQSELDRLQSAVREEQAASAAEIARLQAATREARLAADQRIAEHKARADVRVSEAESAAVARIDSVLAQVNEELIVMIRVAQRQAAEHAASKAKREFQLAQARLVDTQQQLRIEEQVLASKRQDFEEARAQVQALEQQVSQAQQMLQAVQQVLQAPQPQAQPMAE